jgi:hypothetical protein
MILRPSGRQFPLLFRIAGTSGNDIEIQARRDRSHTLGRHRLVLPMISSRNTKSSWGAAFMKLAVESAMLSNHLTATGKSLPTLLSHHQAL